MKQRFTATITREGEWYVAQCLEVNVVSQGETEQESIENLREALVLHFESPRATVAPHVKHVEIELGPRNPPR